MMGGKKIIWLLVLLVAVSVAMLGAGCNPVAERGAQEAEQKPGQEEKGEVGEEMAKGKGMKETEGAPEKEILLQYLGHSSFLLQADELSVLMDPYSPDVGYGALQLKADLVTASHEHLDHNYVAAVPEAKVLRGLTSDALGWEDISFTAGDLTVTNLPTYHDGSSGKLRGRNSAFIFDLPDFRLVHLGDLGHLLSESDLEKLAPVDILLIPVGGHYTIDAGEAKEIIEQVKPKVAIPMHYRLEATRNWPIAGLDEFIAGLENVKKVGKKPLSFKAGQLPENTEIWVMEPNPVTKEKGEK
jgi:L-ascorbate metabolism protein UlaG (beta-lactamase superfamily)